MIGINDLIYYIHDGNLGKTIYDGMFGIIVGIEFLFFLYYRRRYNITKKQSLIISVIVAVFIPLLAITVAWVECGFNNPRGYNIVPALIFFPLVCILAAKWMKIPQGIVLDYVAPGAVLFHAIGHIACPFLGCCAGIPCEIGIWNPVLNMIVFPIQWLFTLVGIIVFIVLLRYEKKCGYDGKGRAYAYLMIFLGCTRFFLEYLRLGEKLFYGISLLAIYALVMFLVGVAWLFASQEMELMKQEVSGSSSGKGK